MAMKMILVWTLLLWHGLIWAFETRITPIPKNPVVGESFQLVISVYSNAGGGEPTISLDPGGLDILKRRNDKAVTARLSGGKFTKQIEYIATYEMEAKAAKTYMLTGIFVEFGGERKRIPNRPITVLREPKRLRNYFIKSVVSKDKIYMGRGHCCHLLSL